MQGVKVAILVALAHLSKICVTLLVIKLIALKVGPDGIGFLGNYMSLVSIAAVMAGGGISSGIIKYISDYQEDQLRRAIFIKNALLYSLFFSLTFCILFFPFSEGISEIIFDSIEYSIYIKLFFILQIFNGVTNFCYGVFNGMKENWKYSSSVLASNILVLIASYYLIEKYLITGAIISLTLPLIFGLFPSLVIFGFKRIKINFFSFDKLIEDSSNLFKYTLMLSFSAICFPVVEIFIRKIIITILDLSAVGMWQATMKLSTSYLSFFSIFLSFYLIPRVSAEFNFEHIKSIVVQSMILIVGFFVCIFAIFIVYSDFIIELVFSSLFFDIKKYIYLQIAGDLFRVIGWCVGFVVIAKAATKIYIFSEVFQAVSFLLFVVLVLNLRNGVEGVVYGYLLGNMLYCALACIGFFVIYKRKIGKKS